jgi:hypothetical protein
MSSWINRLTVSATEPELVSLANAFAAAPPPEPFGVPEQTPSAEEWAVIDAVRHAVAAECAEWGSACPVTPPGQIHFLSPEDFDSLFDGHRAINTMRHTYLRTGLPLHVLVYQAAHELSHGHSYLHLAIGQFTDDDGCIKLRPATRRHGISCFVRHGTEKRRVFLNVNEAVTDILADRAIRRLQRDCGLDPAIVEEAAGTFAHWPTVYLVGRMFRYLKDDFGGKRSAARNQLLRDYMTGTNGFLKAMRRRQPGSVRRLADLSHLPVPTAIAAAHLGFPDTVETILTHD